MKAAIEIFFDDLEEDKQQEILRAFGIQSSEDMNWEVCPVAIVPVPEE